MLKPPFALVRCSWPRPTRYVADCWDAPPMPTPFWPQPHWVVVGDSLCWMIDWRDLFRRRVPGVETWDWSGQMRGFHVVFRLRVGGDGRLRFWADDNCIIRRDGRIIHPGSASRGRGGDPGSLMPSPQDPLAHLTRHAIDVRANDVLEVVQWQNRGGWLWGAWLDRAGPAARTATDVLLPYLELVRERLRQPEGPPLKVFTDGRTPARTVVALYSLILNGYAPSEVVLFGEHQWNTKARSLLATALPFARVVATATFCDRLAALGGPPLVDLAHRRWPVMKACVALLSPPDAFCVMDDDVLILDRVDDALAAFQRYDLVFAADGDFGSYHMDAWGAILGREEPIRTGTFNAGLYWMRNRHDPRTVAAGLLRLEEVQPEAFPWIWEQGLIAVLFADSPTQQLPVERYFYPLWDGMPGGFLEYDYARNPCGFASVHFGGAHSKPGDRAALALAGDVLGRICPPQEGIGQVSLAPA